ncbi:MAG: sel1 repeat family protein [Rhodospirillales bacterium]|nr:sel1 repeat family protein [Rhodospirillales bacterium]
MNVRVLNSVLFIALFVLLISAQPVAAEDQLPASAQNGPTAKPDEQAQALEPAGGEKQIAEDAKADQDVKNEDPSSPEELFALAMKYETGKGEKKDLREAARLYTLSAEQGHMQAQYKIGLMNEEGAGLVRNYKQAVKWYGMAAEQGHILAQSNLARLYYDGQNVAQDYKLASLLARSAAKQDDLDSQILLAKMYHYGNGMPQDYKRAAFWYRKAAQKGSDYAQYSLAIMYLYGRGVTRNPQEAYAWANLSAAQGYYEADDLREEIARSLTQQELAKAQNISKMYYKKYVEPF